MIDVSSDEVVTRRTDDLVAMTFSLSSAAPYRFGAGRDRFKAEPRALLRVVSPGGTFAERRRGTSLQMGRAPTRR